MANNIREKNIVYSFDEQGTMPYSHEKQIGFSSSNSYINSTSMNNVYLQLIDNDLFVLLQLMAKKNYTIGPLILEDDGQASPLVIYVDIDA